MARRSLLFSPGDQPTLMRKAPNVGADALVFDLEDAVEPAEKPQARTEIGDVITDPAFDPKGELYVRINTGALGQSGDGSNLSKRCRLDLETVRDVASRLDGIVVPKVSGRDELNPILDTLADLPDLVVLAQIESAAGVLSAPAIARTDRVDALILGAEDLRADLGATKMAGGREIQYARDRVLTAARAARIDAIDTIYADIADTDGLATDAERVADLGYTGKLAIHPSQVAVINEAFSPSDEEITWAQRVLDASSGDGVTTVDGEMIESTHVAQAERILAQAEDVNQA